MKHDQHFDTGDATADIRRRTVRGGAATFASRAIVFAVTIASMMVLSRILTPGDFGLIQMVTAVTAILLNILHLGLDTATVQREKIDQRQVSTLFWVNILLGGGLTVGLMAAAPLMAAYNEKPELVPIVMVCSGIFLLTGLGIQHRALLNRQMRFVAISVLRTVAPTVALLAAIVAALFGAGYWALVVQILVLPFVLTAGSWLVCRWRPDWVFDFPGARGMISFGVHLTGYNFLGAAARRADKIIVGSLFGETVLGFYGKAFALILLPLQQLNTTASRVAVGALSRLQNDMDRYRLVYGRGIQLLATAEVPLVAFAFVAADVVIPFFYGGQWNDSVPFVRLMTPYFICITLNPTLHWAFISLGRARERFVWGGIEFIAAVIGISVGLRWGAEGVALGLSIAICSVRVPGFWMCYRGTPLRARDPLRALSRPFVAALLAGLALHFLRGPLPSYSAEWSLLTPVNVLRYLGFAVDFAMCAGIFGVVYAVAWTLLPGGRKSIRELRWLSQELRPARKKAVGDEESAGG